MPNAVNLNDARVYLFNTNYFPPNDIFQFSNLNARINGVTVINQSNATVGLYISRQAGGSPDVVVQAGQALGIPMPSAQYVAVSFASPMGAPPSGQAYIHWTTDLIVATSSPVPASSSGTSVWDSAVWDSGSWQ
jgi:murein DD-endopeptidase MepM/ murein hydrolase activator NlpD